MRVLVAAAAALALGCSDGPTPVSGPASVTVEPGDQVRLLGIGDTQQLTATPRDEQGNPVSATVTWTSTNNAVATVSSSGLVTATGIGTATVRATAGSATDDVAVTVQQAQFNTNPNQACTNPNMRGFTIATESAHLIIAVGTDNPPGGFTAQDYAELAATFENLLYPVVTQNFGTTADIDGNGKVIAFFTRAVNELTPRGSNFVISGFFFGRDLFPKTANSFANACPASNEAEMFYLLAPDPNGVAGDARSTERVKQLTAGVIAHEFQHLINSSRRIYINPDATYPETTYMEEGLSHIAEEMVFYEASGLLPRSNLGIDEIRASAQRVDAFNLYMISNASRFSSYLKEPTTNAPYQRDDDLATRGGIWSFLRYLADRGTPGSTFTELTCPSPAVLSGIGASCGLEGSAAQQFSVPAGSNAGEFTIVAFVGNLPPVQGTTPPAAGSISLSASASPTIPVVGPPNPSIGPSGASFSTAGAASAGSALSALPPDQAFHARLRAMERRELPRRAAAARAMYALRNQSRARLYSAPGSAAMATAPVEPVWGQLVNSNDTGIVNLRGRFGQDITGAAQDWAVANYVDDIGLANLPTQYRHPSWNFRSLLPWLSTNGASGSNPTVPGSYPLRVITLSSQTNDEVLVDGGAAYYRFGVAPGTTSTVRFTVAGAAPPSNLKLVLVRTK